MRKGFLGTVAALVVVLAILASAPWWLGAALPAALRPLHIRFARYGRVGYSRFELRGVEYDRAPVKVTIGRVEADTPAVWLWRRLRGSDRPALGENWSVVVAPHGPAREPKRPPGMVSLHVVLGIVARRLERYLPRVQLRNGSVSWARGGFRLADAEWRGGTLAFSGLRWPLGEASGRVTAEPGGGFAAQAEEPDRGLRTELRWDGPEVAGRGWIRGREIALNAHYGPRGWLPERAGASAPSWTVSGAAARLAPAYGRIDGSGRAAWKDGSFTIDVHADATPGGAGPRSPLPTGRSLPPVEVDVRLAGDRTHWSVDSLRIRTPFAGAALSRPLRFGYGAVHGAAKTAENAEVRIDADLSGWPDHGVSGRISARVRITGASGLVPTGAFTASGSDLSWGGWRLGKASAEGSWTVSGVAISRATVEGPSGSLAGSGRWSFAEKELESARADLRLAPAALARLLPPGMSASGARLKVSARGRWPDLAHRGEGSLAAWRAGRLNPVDLSVAWSGHGWTVRRFSAEASAGRTRLTAAGSAARSGIDVTRAEFFPAGAGPWRQRGPVRIGWSPALSIRGLRLAGPGASSIALDLDLSAGAAASGARLALKGVSTDWIRDVLPWRGPDIRVRTLTLSGRWLRDRLAFSAGLDAELPTGGIAAAGPAGPARIKVSATGDGRSLAVRDLEVEAGGRKIASADGTAPVWWRRRKPFGLRFDPDGALSIRARTEAGSGYWSALARRFGLELDDPKAALRLEGTLRRPRGELTAGVRRLGWLKGAGPAGPGHSFALPRLENVALAAHVDTDEVVLDRLTGTVEGAEVRASGRIPVAALNGPLPRVLKAAQGRLAVAGGTFAPLARAFPQVLSPRGTWRLDASAEGGAWKGRLEVRDAALAPAAGIGLIQGIDGDFVLGGRSARIERLTALWGGQPVEAGGEADFPPGLSPRYRLTLRGRDVPIVRQPGLVVRADLDLGAASAAASTTVRGTVTIGDGVLVGDLTDLLPKSQTGGRRPPPYFSVETAPFSRWLLDVDVSADRSLKARTAIFNGTASGRFHLFGTLADPRAVGQLAADEGQVSLPFANFDIQFAAVRLTSEDPFHPTIEANAAGRAYDYDLRMNVRGPAEDPIVTFSSNPALPSDQVLLLVMAGQLPPIPGSTVTAPSQMAGLGAYVGRGLYAGIGGGGGDRLQITSGQEISVKGRPTYEIDYRLGRRWWFVWEYDPFDDYDAGFKVRLLGKDRP